MMRLASEVSGLKSQNNKLRKSFIELERSVSFTNTQYEEKKKKITYLENQQIQLTEYTNSLEIKIKDLHFCPRNSCLEIRNTPDKHMESYDDSMIFLFYEASLFYEAHLLKHSRRPTADLCYRIPPYTYKKLFYMSREFAKANNYDFCWVMNGNIFLRRTAAASQILVKSEKTLKDLKPQD
ncbi:hypothetical protein ACJJTC_007325 [Scirpophaga incertulas]